MKSMTIISAVFNEESGFIEVAKEIVNDDDSIEYAGHSFHPETVEWLVAVYDTEDLDEIIDIILHEPYAENVNPYATGAKEARDNHKQKIEKFKEKHTRAKRSKVSIAQSMEEKGIPKKFTDVIDEDPISFIKSKCSIDEKVVKEKKKQVQELRRNYANRIDPSKPRTAEERLESLLRGRKVLVKQDVVRQDVVRQVKKPAIILKNGKRVKQ